MSGTWQDGKPLNAEQSCLPCLIDVVYAQMQDLIPAMGSLKRKKPF